jgi:predicted acetyltransferase
VVRGVVLTGGRAMGIPSVRRPSEDDFGVGIGIVRTAFLETPPSDHEVAARRALVDLARMRVAVDGDGRICGSARAFPTPLTTPGGEVAAGGVTSVGVLPTHRRQGHLTRMMRELLDDGVERDEPVSVLVAAEYPIYGRYGYGPATEACTLRLDATARWRGEPAGRVEIVAAETWAGLLGDLYERQRRRNPGHIRWNPVRWRMAAGLEPSFDGHDDNRHRRTKVIWRDDAGEVAGAAIYDGAGGWEDNRPNRSLKVEWLVAATERAERELLRFLASVDWVTRVEVEPRPVDDATALALVDGRQAVLVDRWDHVWLRVLDVPAALAARRYAARAALVIEVDDPGGYTAGRFQLDAGPDGAECARTDAEPDLAVPVSALGAVYLGGTGWSRLAAAGWVDERTPGALARAAAAFAAPRAPWSAMTF